MEEKKGGGTRDGVEHGLVNYLSIQYTDTKAFVGFSEK